MQNNTHIAELRKQLYKNENIPFYSIVVFYGDCELKNIDFVPNGTFIVKSKRVLEVVRNILKSNQPFLYTNKIEVIRILREAVTNGGIVENQIQHSESITDMLGKHRVFDQRCSANKFTTRDRFFLSEEREFLTNCSLFDYSWRTQHLVGYCHQLFE